MDCVGCEKCRLWGKLQVLGLGTALKILFSVEGDNHFNQPVSTDIASILSWECVWINGFEGKEAEKVMD